MYFCSRQVCFKELKIKLFLLNLRHGAQRPHSEACSLKTCTLPYINFVFKCLVLYFGIKKEWLEKSLNTFSLAANILKSKLFVDKITMRFSSYLYTCTYQNCIPNIFKFFFLEMFVFLCVRIFVLFLCEETYNEKELATE